MAQRSDGPWRAGAHERVLGDAAFRVLVESVEDYAIFMLDPGGHVVTWNTGARRLKGWTADEILGESFVRFFPPADVLAGKPDRELKTAAETGRYEEEGWRVRKDGSAFWASVVITAVRGPAGELVGFAKVTRDLTERRKAEENERALIREQAARVAAEAAEQRIRESEERHRQSAEQLAIILQGVEEGIVVRDTQGRIVYANDAAARAWGFSTGDELAAALDHDVAERFEVEDEHGRPLTIDDLPWREVLRGATSSRKIMRAHNRRTGERWSALVVASAVRDADGEARFAITIWHDITERLHAEQSARYLAQVTAALTSSLDYETTLRRIAELAVPELADWCVVDLLHDDGTIGELAVSHVDPAKVALARELRRRYPPIPGAATGVASVIRTGNPELYGDISDELLAKVARDEDHLRIARELGLRSAMIVPLVARDQLVGAITFVFAESGRRYQASDLALAMEVARRAGLAVDNARLYGEAQQAVQVRDSFLSVAAHELRTPCTSLQLQLQSLLRAANRRPAELLESGRIHHNVQVALDQTARLTRLIEQLLDVSRIAADRLQLDPVVHDLVAVVCDVARRFEAALEDAECELRLRTPPGPVLGSWDRSRIEQVLTNLLSNAIKYGARRPIDVEVDSDGASARIVVRDRGIGIRPEDQARIFEPFERAVSSRHYGGFGLGLWITRKIVEAHGGTIVVESAPASGSSFIVELPIAPASSSA